MIPKTIDQRALDAGKRACAQLVRAVSSETSAPLRRAAAGSALARLHELLMRNDWLVLAIQAFVDVRTTVSALVEVYSASLREVAPSPTRSPCAAAEDRSQLTESNHDPVSVSPDHKPGAAEYGQQHPGSGRESCVAPSGCSRAGGAPAGPGAGPFPEDWVPLLVDSSALVATFLKKGVVITAAPTASASVPDAADLQQLQQQGTAEYGGGSWAMVSALLLSDALPALSRLLSAEVQRGPSRALLTPRQLATCLQPVSELIAAAGKLLTSEVPAVSPQRLSQPQPPAPNSPTAAAASTRSAPSPVPPTPAPASSKSSPPAAGPSHTAPAAAELFQGSETCPKPPAAAGEPGGSAAAPWPQGHDPDTSYTSPTPPTPQTLGSALLCAMAESGVVEAACRAAVGAVEQGPGGQTQQRRRSGAACAAGSDREQLLFQLMELPWQVLNLFWHEGAASLPREPLRTILAGTCVQYALAAHSVSQLHAVDGGTTYGLPYDSLMPLLWQEGTGMLTCNCAIIALHWRKQTCTFGGYELAPCGLSPRGLFELCLREAEVAADCWRRRNGLPAAAAAAAGGSVGDSSSGKAGRRGRQLGQALGTAEVETGRRVGLCRSGGAGSEVGVSSGGPAADPPRATLEPRRCPELAMQAMSCSRLLMDSSCMAGDRAGAGAAEAGTPVLEGSGGGTGRSRTPGIAGSSGNIAVGEGDQGAGGGSLDRSWCGAQGGEGGDDTQGSSSSSSNSMDTGAWLRDGGPLARRWWRAAVAAVHCAMDKLVGSQGEAFYVHWLLDPSLAMPVPDPGYALPIDPPPGLSAALDSGYLPCLERTLRTCFRSGNTPIATLDLGRGVFGCDSDTIWPLLLAFGDEREAAAFLATAAKVARRTCVERARPGGDRKACAAVMAWLGAMVSLLWRAAEHVALQLAFERGFRECQPSAPVQAQGRETAAAGDGDGGGGDGDGGGGTGGGDGGGGNGGGDGGGGSDGGDGGGGNGGSDGGGGNGGGDSGGGNGGGDGSSDGGGNASVENHVNTNDPSGSGGGGARGGGRCVRRSAGDNDTGARASDRKGGVHSSARTSGAVSSDGGRGDDRNDGCGDGLGGGGSSGGGGTDGRVAPPTSGPSGCGTAAAAATATAAATAAAGGLSPPEQQLLRLLSFALSLWLPLWMDLAADMVTDGRLTRSWHGDVHVALELLESTQHLCVGALGKKDLRAVESWRSIVTKSGGEVEGMLEGCCRLLEREAATAGLLSSGDGGVHVRKEDGVTAEQLYKKMEEVRETAFVLGDLQEAVVTRGEVEGGWERLLALAELGLMAPPCDARQVLPCCSNPRCAELAGDSEAGVVLRRCGKACGGAAAYCCAACQRAHWAAGHREECVGKRRAGSG